AAKRGKGPAAPSAVAGRAVAPGPWVTTPPFAGTAKRPISPRQRRLPDLPDLVTHPRRVLEFQVAGVLVHLLFQGLEPGGKLRRVERGVVLGLVGHAPGLAG